MGFSSRYLLWIGKSCSSNWIDFTLPFLWFMANVRFEGYPTRCCSSLECQRMCIGVSSQRQSTVFADSLDYSNFDRLKRSFLTTLQWCLMASQLHSAGHFLQVDGHNGCTCLGLHVFHHYTHWAIVRGWPFSLLAVLPSRVLQGDRVKQNDFAM